MLGKVRVDILFDGEAQLPVGPVGPPLPHRGGEHAQDLVVGVPLQAQETGRWRRVVVVQGWHAVQDRM